MDNGVVVNVIEADSIEIAQELTGLTAMVSDTAGIGYVLDGETGEFTAPDPVVDDEPILADPAPAPTAKK